MTVLGADRDTLLHDLLALCAERIGEMTGEPPEIGETRPVGGAEFRHGPVVRVVRDDQVFTIGISVQPPEGGDAAGVEGFAQAIADALIARGSDGGFEITAASSDALVAPEALATGFESNGHHVGTVMTFVSIDGGEDAAAPEDAESATETVTEAPAGSDTPAGSDAPVDPDGESGAEAEVVAETGAGPVRDGTDDGAVDALVGRAPVATDQGTASVLAAATAEGAPTAGSVLDPSLGRSLGTLSQVELNVTVQLGSAELSIRDLMALSPGSVVRVGTQVGEPFPILVNGRVAAKGDLVVVNGRLGVRIRELISG
jgi:flagellar motor switch protein FliN/FliY